MTNVVRLYSCVEAMEWITRVTRLWNAEFRVSYDIGTGEYVVEIVYSNSSVKGARSRVLGHAVNQLIDSLGGFNG
jgi:hypothetical protein